jgi:hypothetical protein
MARHKKPFFNFKMLLFLGTVVLIVAAGVLILRLESAHQFSGLAEFPVERYLENDGLLSQEDFRFQGTIDNIILRSSADDRFLASIRLDKPELILPVLMEIGHKNLQRNQRIILKVNINSRGTIVCKECKKI